MALQYIPISLNTIYIAYTYLTSQYIVHNSIYWVYNRLWQYNKYNLHMHVQLLRCEVSE